MPSSSVFYCHDVNTLLCVEWDSGVEKDVRHSPADKRAKTLVVDFKLQWF